MICKDEKYAGTIYICNGDKVKTYGHATFRDICNAFKAGNVTIEQRIEEMRNVSASPDISPTNIDSEAEIRSPQNVDDDADSDIKLISVKDPNSSKTSTKRETQTTSNDGTTGSLPKITTAPSSIISKADTKQETENVEISDEDDEDAEADYLIKLEDPALEIIYIELINDGFKFTKLNYNVFINRKNIVKVMKTGDYYPVINHPLNVCTKLLDSLNATYKQRFLQQKLCLEAVILDEIMDDIFNKVTEVNEKGSTFTD